MRFLHVLCSLAGVAAAVDVQVSKRDGKKSSALQYGLMFEDINYSGDGGIYAELIQNRAFQGDDFIAATLDPWVAIGNSSISLDSQSKALSEALPQSVAVKAGSKAKAGIANPGYWGIDVRPQTYTGTFWVLGAYKGDFTAALESEAGEILASASVASRSQDGEWTKHEFKLHPTTDRGSSNNFALTFEPEEEGQVLNFNLISLFPPTYKNRPNGMRIELMEALKEMNPSFMRFPGGNNLQGHKAGSRWKWNETIGDLIDRPGRTGAWGYFNTDGLGLIEYMHWCQDLDLEPVLILWAGLYLDGTVIPQDELHIYIEDALNEIEFLTGDPSTEYGAKRAALGYEEPFRLKYVGVGNEDHFSNGMTSYKAYRFRMFFDAISAAYPNLTILSSTIELDSLPAGAAIDYHDYGNPDGAVRNFTLFDNYTGDHKILVGEYGVARDNGNEVLWKDHRRWSWWIASVAEAIFYLGVERNPDKVYGGAFAPLLQNINDFQWNPNMITFNADPDNTIKSTSYEVMKLYSNNRFTKVLSVKNSENYNPGFWAAGYNKIKGSYLWKGAVYNTTEDVDFRVIFPGVRQGSVAKLTVLTAPDPYAENVFGYPGVVITNMTEIKAVGNRFAFSLPEWSVAVLDWTC